MALLLSLKRTVDLEPGLTTPQVFHVSQNDVGTRLYVALEQGGTAYAIPDGTTAKVQGCNALGEPFEAITATVSASEVYFTITDQDVTQFAGNAKCEVVLTNGTNILGTANFIVAVEASPMGADVPAIYTNPVQAYIEGVVQDYVDDDILPDITSDIASKADASDVGDLTDLETTDKTSIVDAVNELVSGKVNVAQGSGNAGKALVVNSSGNVEPVDALVDVDSTLSAQGDAADAKATGDALALKANASTVAPEFSDQSTYTAGSYVLKNGVLYRFTADHTGAWTGTDAEEVTVGSELNRLEDSSGSGTGLTEDIKQALLTLAEKVAYIDEDGQDYYDALHAALYPPANLTRISCVYTQSGTVYDTDSLDDLKSDLVVTAHFDNGTMQTVTTYVLSGTLIEGTSTITVRYGGKSTTFSVAVTHNENADWDYIWRYSDGLPPASDWTWKTSGGSGQVREIVSDGLLIGAKSGTTARYYMPYAPSQILSAGGGVVEFTLYVPDYSSGVVNTTKAHYFDVTITDGTNVLCVMLSHAAGKDNSIYIYDGGNWYSSDALLDTFDYETPYAIKLEMDSTTAKGKVYINGVVKADDITLTSITDMNQVRMLAGGFTFNSTAAGAVVQSVKVKYGLS